jgi:site-specific DNA-methyltransferase (cytosine-N4-specific)
MKIGEYSDFIINSIKNMLSISKYTVFNIQMISTNKKAVFDIFINYSDKIKEIVIWDKLKGEPAVLPNVMNSAFEFLFIFSSNGDAHNRQFKDSEFHGNVDNVLRFGKRTNKKSTDNHSAAFPEFIPNWAISILGKNYKTILDPFFGLGTVGIVCERQKKQWIGIEIEERYCAIAAKRIEAERKQLKLF